MYADDTTLLSTHDTFHTNTDTDTDNLAIKEQITYKHH